ncbi:MAG TPA: tetratricopeptide repeat protein [Gallionellaceae bacterium]
MFDRFRPGATLCALLLLLSLAPARADEVQDANKLFKQGQLAPALAKVDAYLVRKPKDAQARFLKGLIKTEQGQSDEAIRIFAGLTEDYPELPEPYNNLAVLYAAQEQYDKAKVALEAALRTHPSYATAHENLGDLYAKMASLAYNRALQLDSSSTGSQTKLALIKELYSNTRAGKPAITHEAAAIAAAQPAPGNPQPPVSQPAVVAAVASPAASTAAPVTTAAVQPAAAVSAVELPAGKPSPAGSEEVLKAVQDWAAAWSANNVPKYLSFYARDFRVPGNESRSSWEKQRHDRIAKPKSIRVSIESARVHLADASHASVTFRQFYRSGSLKTSTLKTLEMVKLGGKWQILEERAGR